jgi:LmbE family N-acetylglucosaminyl deacetylase
VLLSFVAFSKRTCPPSSDRHSTRRRTSALTKRETWWWRKFVWIGALASLLTAIAIQSFGPASIRAQENVPPAAAETPLDRIAVHQALLDLGNPWTVMCVAAHPDDEDGASLIVLRHKHGAHTVSLFSTYGEGGQNAVGPQLYEELGVIRARETMAAARIQGSEPYFLGLTDFGFSKSADEAFRVWGHEEALRRMVLKIRELHPDVIITNHDTTSGHGHHQATGRLLLEAFDVAANPQSFPEQLKDGIQTWQVKRVFVRTRGNTQDDNVVTLDPNEQDPVRETSYAEQALQALQEHKTQGPWPKTVAQMAARFRGSPDGKLPLIRYQLVRGAENAAPLPTHAATFLDGLKLPDTVMSKLAILKIDERPLFDFETKPDELLRFLIAARKAGVFQGAELGEGARLGVMKERLDHALALLSGVTLAASPVEQGLIPGTAATCYIKLGNDGKHTIGVRSLTVTTWGQERPVEVSDQLPPGTETLRTTQINTPRNATITVPSARHLYDGHLFGETITAKALADLDGAVFRLRSSVQSDVVPAVEIKRVSPRPYVWTPATSNRTLSFTVEVTNHESKAFDGALALSDGKRIIGAGQKLRLSPYATSDIKLESSALASDINGARGRKARAAAEKGSINLSVRNADSDEEVTRESISVVKANARVARGIHVGYVESFDQTLEQALNALGVKADKLAPVDIQSADLKVYDTIIIDNRGYEFHPELVSANERLLSFVNEGGTLLVFYHKDNEWNPDPKKNRPQLAPYPIVLNDARVTDENAAITFLNRTHRLLNFPNRIAASDFAGWIQERGLYYPKEWDSHYTALFSMHDPGEPPLLGGLLVAPYGRGHYIYTSMVWYRELRAAVPGAYRMFANMISYGHR